MPIDDLLIEYWHWTMRVKNATGWPSAFYAAKRLEGICRYAKSQGFNLVNRHLIRVS